MSKNIEQLVNDYVTNPDSDLGPWRQLSSSSCSSSVSASSESISTPVKRPENNKTTSSSPYVEEDINAVRKLII